MKNKSRLQDPAPVLNRLFQRLEKKYYSLLAWHGISAIFLMLAATAGLSFILDFTFEMHWTLRLAVLAAAAALWLRVLIRGRTRIRSALSREDLLAAVENSSADLDGELANIVEFREELAAESGDAVKRSELEKELFDRALSESQQAVNDLEIGRVLATGSVRRNQLAAVGAIALLVSCGFFFPDEAALWVHRNLALSSTHWPRETHFFLERAEPVWHHPRKARLDLRGWVNGNPRDVFIVVESGGSNRKSRLVPGITREGTWQTVSAVTEGGPGAGEAVSVRAAALSYSVPSVLDSFDFYFLGGDNRSRKTRVEIHDRPKVVSSVLRIRAPEHTGLGEKELVNPTGEIEVIAGSTVAFEAECDGELESAWGRFGEDGQSEAELLGEKGFRYSFEVTASGFLEAGVKGRRWGFDSEETRLALVALPDAQPEIELQVAGEIREVTPEGRVEYNLHASDDFGFSELRLLIGGLQTETLEDGKPTAAELPPWDAVKTDDGVIVDIKGTIELASLELEPGMNISFRAVVRDNDGPGGYKESFSEEINFTVVSAEKLKENLDKVRVKAQERLEELAFREGSLVEELLRLQADLSERPDISAGGEGEPGELAAGENREREEGERAENNPEGELLELARAEPSGEGQPSSQGGRDPSQAQGRPGQSGRPAAGQQGQDTRGEQGEGSSRQGQEGEEPGEREPREGEAPGEESREGEPREGETGEQSAGRQGSRAGRQGQPGQSGQGRQAGEAGENPRQENGESAEEPGERRGGEEDALREEGERAEEPKVEQGESETPEGQRNSAGTGRGQQGQQGQQQQGQQGQRQQGQQGEQQQGQQGQRQQGQEGQQQQGQQGQRQQGQQGEQQQGQQGQRQQGQQGQQQQGQQGQRQQGQQGQQQQGQQGQRQQGQQGEQQQGQQGQRQQQPQNGFERLSNEQEQIAGEARELARSLREMADDLERNQLMGRSESERFEEEIARPLEDLGENRLPRSAEDIESIPRSGNPQEDADRAEAEAEKISRNLKDVSRRLAGSGDFREILQRLESIVELQGKVINETKQAAGPDDSGQDKGAAGKKDK